MNDDQVNPYAPPQAYADAENNSLTPPASALDSMRSRSVIVMIILSVVTLGLYINYWVHQLATTLNHRLKGEQISMGLVATFWAVSVTSLLWIVLEIVTVDDPMVVGIGSLLTRADMIFTIFMAFTIRGRLNTLIMVPREDRAWFHGMWTFLFGICYLQWKLNRNLRSPELSAAMPATPE